MNNTQKQEFRAETAAKIAAAIVGNAFVESISDDGGIEPGFPETVAAYATLIADTLLCRLEATDSNPLLRTACDASSLPN